MYSVWAGSGRSFLRYRHDCQATGLWTQGLHVGISGDECALGME